MVFSMTGFSRKQAELDGKRVSAEIASVNNRFLEIQMRLPKNFAHLESELRELVAGSVRRGKLTINLSLEESQEALLQHLQLNREAAALYHKVLLQLKEQFGMSGEIRLEHFVNLPDLIRPQDEDLEDDRTRLAFREALTQALTALNEMRRAEGGRLATDIAHHIDQIEKVVAEVEESARETLRLYSEKLKARLKELLGDIKVSEEMLVAEAALVAERADITEECVRIRSHIDLVREALDDSEPVGKKLNFVLQELNREINTIGSKSIAPETPRRVILLKEEVEKIREQVQNIE